MNMNMNIDYNYQMNDYPEYMIFTYRYHRTSDRFILQIQSDCKIACSLHDGYHGRHS